MTELVIADCEFNDHYMHSIGLEEEINVGDYDDTFTGENLIEGVSISNLTNLKWLTIWIERAIFGDITLLHISRLKSLHSLNINCKNVIVLS